MSEVEREKLTDEQQIAYLKEENRRMRLALNRVASYNPMRNVTKPGGISIVRAFVDVQDLAEKALLTLQEAE